MRTRPTNRGVYGGNDYVVSAVAGDDTTFVHHISLDYGKSISMQIPFDYTLQEFVSLKAKSVFDPVATKLSPEQCRSIIPSRCLVKEKCDSDGKVERIKCRLVAAGHRQCDVDTDETFAPTVRTSSVLVYFL